MSEKVPYTWATKFVTGVRRYTEEHGFRSADETWTFINSGETAVAVFEEADGKINHEKVAQQFCDFLNALPEKDAEAILQARANQAVEDYVRSLAQRRLTPRDGMPERGYARL